MHAPRELRRLLGPATAFLVGLGVAVGSGIFRTPGLVAAALPSPGWILAAWAAGGVFVLASGMVSAELATRFPKAGGEYVYLREAYGPFVGFFFGWGYTIFITGGGAATIAVAAGEAAAELASAEPTAAPLFGAGILIAVAAVNALGLSAGAGLQNLLTVLKVAAVAAIAAAALACGEGATRFDQPLLLPEGARLTALLAAALPAVLWSYEGTTDAVKLAEEVKDVRRAMPRALIGTALTLTLLYVGANLAFLWVLTPAELAESRFAASDVMERLFGATGRSLTTAASLLVLLGALSATFLTTVRVTFALARDGLAFGALAKMSERQSPLAALALVTAIALVFTVSRGFAEILNIYFLAAAILFGLAYGSLIVFRVRDARRGGAPPEGVFRAPLGPVLAALLIGVQLAMAASIVAESPTDSLKTLALLAGMAAMYLFWRKRA